MSILEINSSKCIQDINSNKRIQDIPKIISKEYIQKFGDVEGEFRGSNKDKLLNPPIEHIDNYHWLRDDTRTNPEVLECIKQQNEYTDSLIKPYEENKKEIYKKIKSHLKEDYDTLKYSCGDKSEYKYFSRFLLNKDYQQYYRVSEITGKEEILLDINELAIGKKQCDVSNFVPSPNHQYISYGVDYDGSEQYEIIIYDLINNNILEHTIPKLSYSYYFWINSENIYYVLSNERNSPHELYLYNLTTKVNTLVYKELNSEYHISAYTTSNNKYIIINRGNYDSNESYIINFEVNPLEYTLFKSLVDNNKYYLEYHNDYWYITTNLDNSTNWKIMRCHINNINEFEDFIPYNEYIYISDCKSFQNYIIYKTVYNGNIYINIVNPNNKTLRVINHLSNNSYTIDSYYEQLLNNTVSSDVYYIDYGINENYNTDILNIKFSSPTSPIKYFDYDMNTLEYKLVYEKTVPNYNESLYESKNIWVPQEGTRLGIPLTLIYKKDKFIQDGSMPLYLYGYGSYGHSIDNMFNYKILPLLDHGYIYAIAHIRGGSELGYDWYMDGKMYNKLNTFNDFIRCTEFMIQEKYTKEKNIVIEGRSAGGLLIGACITMKPELYKVAVLGVPFVDILNTMADSKIPLTIEEWTQWGNPNESKDYQYMKQYCPYTNISSQKYPHLFISGGLYDPRVPYWEPLKFLAKVREYKKDSNIQVLRMETEQGHFGGSSRYKYIEELAEKYTFIFNIFL